MRKQFEDGIDPKELAPKWKRLRDKLARRRNKDGINWLIVAGMVIAVVVVAGLVLWLW